MCGICGWAGDRQGDPALLSAMTDLLAHRGPDDRGTWQHKDTGLGHQRLAVIDTSPAGHQPMVVDQTAVVLNGEIYNYQTLKEELLSDGHQFAGHSDTEVLLRGYLAWGIDDLLERIDGMYAFALWDIGRQRMHLVRDRMGEKPLYYACLPSGALVFASEMNAVAIHPEVSKDVSPTALRKYLSYDFIPPPHSILKDVQKMAPGHVLTWEQGKVTGNKRYWDIPAPTEDLSQANEAADQLWTEIVSAVSSRLISDVPLGLFLSGGLDSSAVAAAACELRDPSTILTFCVGFDDPSFDESQHARTVAEHLGTQHHQEILDAETMLKVLPQMVSGLDEPLADPSLVPTHLLARFTRQHVTVALGGDGGDELFLGYPTFSAHNTAKMAEKIPAALRRRLLGPMVQALPVSEKNWSFDFKLKRFLAGLELPAFARHFAWIGGTHPFEHDSLLEPAVFAAADEDPLDDVSRLLLDWPAVNDLDKLTYLYARLYLAEGVLQKVDRATMAYGLECRAPLLAPNVVRCAMSIPSGLKIRQKQSKWVLREALKSRLPKSILERPKKGFGMPLTAWLKGPLLPLCRELLTDPSLRDQALFKKEACEKLIDEHVKGFRDHRKTLWALMVYQLWEHNRP